MASAGFVGIQAGRRSPDNAEAVLFSFPSARLARTERLPEGKGFLVERAGSTAQDGLCLALTRQAAGGLELFAAMACDVVATIDRAAGNGASESRILKVLLGRVLAWQQFMSRGGLSLSHEAELGLAGELLFMALLIDSGVLPETVLKGWVGPDDAPQDFLLGSGAIEVKATMSSSGFPVKIGSLEQLDDAVASPLFLAAVRFSGGDGGLTLPEMIAEVERRLPCESGAIDQFRERLIVAGFCDVHASQYFRRFEPKERRILFVSEGFPRLTPGSVPAGTTRAIYEINLDHAGKFVCDIGIALTKLGVTG